MQAFSNFCVYALVLVQASPVVDGLRPLLPLDYQAATPDKASVSPNRKLHGKFLHITDPHPDSHYHVHSSTEKGAACHHGSGAAGVYGAETSDCDSPFSLINETFKWIEANVKDSVDFVIWTGDSARHDNDDLIPRTEDEIFELNEYMVQKVLEVFGKSDNVNDSDPTNDLVVPVVPNLGNNDILPHNVLAPGQNRWTKTYASIWREFIPEEQRHGFERGGWFYVEVIPNTLAVFSLNTLYFFDKNAAVDGCADGSEPGYEQMEWLRIQLQFLRDRGMKAIMTGHVPPARTDSKNNWDESCWQKYSLWMMQYRDIVVGSMYGHMNIDHFMFQDEKDITIGAFNGSMEDLGENKTLSSDNRTSLNGFISLQSTANYLMELRDIWSELPRPPKRLLSAPSDDTNGESSNDADDDDDGDDDDDDDDKDSQAVDANKKKKKKPKKSKEERYYNKIGGQWGERFAMSLVGPSIVPNYFPTLRVFEYNLTGLEDMVLHAPISPSSAVVAQALQSIGGDDDGDGNGGNWNGIDESSATSKLKKKGQPQPKDPGFTMPNPPSKAAPPGPAYSPQTLTLLGYTQYFANLTYINNDFLQSGGAAELEAEDELVDDAGWQAGMHKGHKPDKQPQPFPKPFEYQVEYSTFNDTVYQLDDLTMINYLKLAWRIGHFKPLKAGTVAANSSQENTTVLEEGSCSPFNATKKKGKKHKKRLARDKPWFTFVNRAFVGAVDEEDIRDQFGLSVPCLAEGSNMNDEA